MTLTHQGYSDIFGLLRMKILYSNSIKEVGFIHLWSMHLELNLAFFQPAVGQLTVVTLMWALLKRIIQYLTGLRRTIIIVWIILLTSLEFLSKMSIYLYHWLLLTTRKLALHLCSYSQILIFQKNRKLVLNWCKHFKTRQNRPILLTEKTSDFEYLLILVMALDRSNMKRLVFK